MTKQKPSHIMFANDDTQEELRAAQQTRRQVPETVEQVPVETPVFSNPNTTIPSHGMLGYPGEIEYRDIYVKDEEILATATQRNFARTMNGVLRGICNNPECFDQMSVYDRDYLLVWIWANNFDPVKKVNVDCKHCGANQTHPVDLTKLDVEELKESYKPLKLPLSKGKDGSFVRVHLNSISDENEAEALMDRTTKVDQTTGKPKSKYSFEHLMLVASIDLGMKLTLEKKVEWIGENMTSHEMGLVRKFHQYFRYGVQETVDYVCSSCEEVTTGMLPFRIDDMLFPVVSDDNDEFLQLIQDS